ncbi:hypothetical protein N5B55_05235 [Ralstonia pickettii]|uniref:hypothetical protein n=1 Tax=Ralstonia pickettii TaxID=329 RepID=UPI002714DDF3|nr:hypothetical protein [Ralstonia pickettii]WKZ86359.1 hypothetical protein N5B55_05235 [Ralstonia pickettii]
MPAAKQNFTIEQRATFKKRLQYRDTRGKPINLAGFTARMQIRSAANAAEVLLDLSTENGRITLRGASGAIDLLVDSTATGAITWTQAVYDLKLIAPDGTELRLLEGKVFASPGVTQ